MTEARQASRSRGLPPAARVWLLNILIAACALPLFLQVRSEGAPIPGLGLAALMVAAVLFAATEVWVIHVEFRREAHTISLNEIPLVLSLIFLAPREVVIAQLVGAAPVLLLHRRQGALKLVFNLLQLALSAEVAALVYHAGLPSGDPLGPPGWLVMVWATISASATGVVAVSAAISLSEGRLTLAKWVPVMAFSLAGSVVNSCLALVLAVVVARDARAAGLMLVPAVALYLAYRA